MGWKRQITDYWSSGPFHLWERYCSRPDGGTRGHLVVLIVKYYSHFIKLSKVAFSFLFTRLLSKMSVLVLDIITYELTIICWIIDTNFCATIEIQMWCQLDVCIWLWYTGQILDEPKSCFFDGITRCMETRFGIGEINCHNADWGITWSSYK